VNDSDFSYLRGSAKPKLFVVGGDDQFAAREKVETLVRTLLEPKRLVIVPGADHFLMGKLGELDRAIRKWMTETVAL